MTFSEFKKSISKIEKIGLPGKDSHLEMAHKERILKLQDMDPAGQNPVKAAVLILFYPNEAGETMLVFILRNKYKGVHSAQIAFPGGRVEPEDANLMQTALRESEEEVGADPKKIHIWRELTEIYIPPSNYMVHPFLGTTDETPTFVPEEKEVDAIIEVKLEDVLNEEFLIETVLSTSYAVNIQVRAFRFQEHIVWGATGMMLNEVKAILQKLM